MEVNAFFFFTISSVNVHWKLQRIACIGSLHFGFLPQMLVGTRYVTRSRGTNVAKCDPYLIFL